MIEWTVCVLDVPSKYVATCLPFFLSASNLLTVLKSTSVGSILCSTLLTPVETLIIFPEATQQKTSGNSTATYLHRVVEDFRLSVCSFVYLFVYISPGD